MFCVVSAIAWTVNVFSTDKLGFGVDSCHLPEPREFPFRSSAPAQLGFPRCSVSSEAIAWTVNVFSTDKLGFGVDSCHLPEPRELPFRSSAPAQLGFPRCSVSSRQSHGLRTCSPPTNWALVWILATYLNLGNFLSDHQLLHSWDFHDVLCRLGNRMDCERVLHRQTGLWCGFLPLT